MELVRHFTFDTAYYNCATRLLCDRLARTLARGPFNGRTDLAGSLGSYQIENLCEAVQQAIFFFGRYEFHETRFVLDHLMPGQCFVDVGANTGYYSLIAAFGTRDRGRVLALEPVPGNIKHLQRNMALNAIRSVEILPVAAASSNGQVSFSMNNDADSAQSGWGGIRSDGELRFQAMTLDTILAQQAIGRVHFLKIDVEGGEPDVLAGAQGLLTSPQFNGPVMLEINERCLSTRGYSTSDVTKYFSGDGWSDTTTMHLPDRRGRSLHTRIFERSLSSHV